MIKNILVVGAAGFIGSNLSRKLVDAGYRVIVLKRSADNISRLKEIEDRLEFYNSDKIDLSSIFSKNKIDLAINLATNFGRAKDTPASAIIDTNILFAIRLAEAAVESDVKCLFNIDSSLDPSVNLYAYTKKVTKQLLKDYFSEKLKIFNLRLEYVYGPNDDLNKLIPMAVDKLKKNQPLEISKAEQELDFLNIEDCTDAFLYVIKNCDAFKNSFNDLQIGSGRTTSLKDLILLIKEVAGSDSVIKFGAVPYRKHEQMYSRADLQTMRDWRPKVSLKDGVKQLIS